jgi:hypothetical protein
MTKLAAAVLALLVILVLLAVNPPTTPGTPAAGRRRQEASATAPVPLQPLLPCDWTLETAQRELTSGRDIVFT